MRRTRMALWEAPMTATVTGSAEGRVVERRGGLRATSSGVSWIWDLEGRGRGVVIGEEPVQRMRRFEETVRGSGSGNFSSGDVSVMVQCLD